MADHTLAMVPKAIRAHYEGHELIIASVSVRLTSRGEVYTVRTRNGGKHTWRFTPGATIGHGSWQMKEAGL